MALTRPRKVTGTLDAVESGSSIWVEGKFNARITGSFTGTIKLERSFDNSTFQVVSKNADGDEAAYTAACDLVCEEPEGAYYRWTATALTAGTPTYRISF